MREEFAVVGRGLYTRKNLLDFLTNNGLSNPFSYVKDAERFGRVDCGLFKILRIR